MTRAIDHIGAILDAVSTHGVELCQQVEEIGITHGNERVFIPGTCTMTISKGAVSHLIDPYELVFEDEISQLL